MPVEQETAPRRWSNRVLVVAVLVLLAAYAVSPKLIVWCHNHGRLLDSRAADVVMFPLQALYEQLEPVRRFYDWYEPRWVDSF